MIGRNSKKKKTNEATAAGPEQAQLRRYHQIDQIQGVEEDDRVDGHDSPWDVTATAQFFPSQNPETSVSAGQARVQIDQALDVLAAKMNGDPEGGYSSDEEAYEDEEWHGQEYEDRPSSSGSQGSYEGDESGDEDVLGRQTSNRRQTSFQEFLEEVIANSSSHGHLRERIDDKPLILAPASRTGKVHP